MKTIVALFLILHGLVHGILALVPNPDDPDAGFASFFSRSWLLTGLGLSESTGKPIAIILAAIATIGFIATGLALLGILVPYDWWSVLAVASAAISLFLLVIFWHPYLIIGILIDAVILVTILFTDWSPEYNFYVQHGENEMANGKYNLRVIGEGIAGAAAIAATILLSPLTRAWYHKWGATEEEVRRSLPGDDLVPHPKTGINIAITIQAPAAEVWPWLMQIGCRRAGWYSYDLLDNGGVPSAKRIIETYQHLKIGDEVPFTPNGNMGFPVAAIDPGRALVMGGTMNTSTSEEADPNDPDLETYLSGAIILFVYELDPGTTRLIYRMPLGWNPNWRNTLMYRGFLEPISFVMARKTLLAIKQRVETAHAGAVAQAAI